MQTAPLAKKVKATQFTPNKYIPVGVRSVHNICLHTVIIIYGLPHLNFNESTEKLDSKVNP